MLALLHCKYIFDDNMNVFDLKHRTLTYNDDFVFHCQITFFNYKENPSKKT